MVEPTGAWTMFHSRDELFDYLKGHSLMSENEESQLDEVEILGKAVAFTSMIR